MLVNDTGEYIGTAGCRLSPVLYGCTLNSPSGVWTVSSSAKPLDIPSRGGRILALTFTEQDTHDSGSAGYALC